jgi:lysophospholipase L1-like esterase
MLAPLLIFQGRRVREKIVLLPEPPGQRHGRQGQGKTLKLLVVGDSAAAGVGADAQYATLYGQLVSRLSANFSVQWHVLAKTGENTQSITTLLDNIDPQPFDIIVTSLGVNDVTSGKSSKQFAKDLDALYQILMQKFTPQQIIFSSMPPMGQFPALPNPLRWYLGKKAHYFDQIIQQITLQHNCDYFHLPVTMDANCMARDGFHPGPLIYAAWASGLAKKIMAIQQVN